MGTGALLGMLSIIAVLLALAAAVGHGQQP